MKRGHIGILLMICVLSSAYGQLPVYDLNYQHTIEDDFNVDGRYWENGSWKDKFSNGTSGYYHAYWNECGIVHGPYEHQIYQRSNVLFNDVSDQLEIVATFDSLDIANGNWEVPSGQATPNTNSIYYYSGAIETLQKFKYGYFEVRCRIPMHEGSFPAFWLWGGGSTYYNEIDIFEYTWSLYSKFSYGHYCRNNESCENTSDCHEFYSTHTPESSLNNYHVYACEWLPNRITWYFDGEEIGNYRDMEYIPQHPMALKINYAIDGQAINPNGIPIWRSSDKLYIDYIKAYKLNCDCNTDIIINDSNINSYVPKVYRNIKINLSNNITLSPSSSFYLRAVDEISIEKNLTVPVGTKFVLETHNCPN